MLALAAAAQCDFAAPVLALVVVALQSAVLLSPRRLAAGLVAQPVVVSLIAMHGCGAARSVSWLLAVCGFQAATAVAVVHARPRPKLGSRSRKGTPSSWPRAPSSRATREPTRASGSRASCTTRWDTRSRRSGCSSRSLETSARSKRRSTS